MKRNIVVLHLTMPFTSTARSRARNFQQHGSATVFSLLSGFCTDGYMQMRIGLISDTHMPGSLRELWPQAIEAFKDVDCVLHAGDLHTLDIVDQLSRLAPTYVARGNGDTGLHDDRLKDCWLLELKGIQVGMVHRFPSPERRPPNVIQDHLNRHFETIPRVMVYGHTHMEAIHTVNGTLCVNPGSPTLPHNKQLRYGTIGFIEIGDDRITASIHQLTEQGLEDHETIRPQTSYI
jgi:putative phosphoesterase